MINKRVNEDLLKTIKGYENRKPYKSPFAYQPEGTVQEADTLKGHVRRTKVLSSIEEAIKLSGLKDVRAKSLGSNNPRNMVNATIEGLNSLKTVEEIAKLRGKKVEELLG